VKRKIEKRKQARYLGAARGVFLSFFPFPPNVSLVLLVKMYSFFFVVCFLLVHKKCAIFLSFFPVFLPLCFFGSVG
jgi:hypothetical protein